MFLTPILPFFKIIFWKSFIENRIKITLTRNKLEQEQWISLSVNFKLSMLSLLLFLNTVKTPIKRHSYFHYLEELSNNCEIPLNYKNSKFKLFCLNFSLLWLFIPNKLLFWLFHVKFTKFGMKMIKIDLIIRNVHLLIWWYN